jgi:GT2 family glycosyltransferase
MVFKTNRYLIYPILSPYQLFMIGYQMATKSEQKLQHISVIVCAYINKRWQALCDCIAGLRRQVLPAHEIVLVIDHNPSLCKKALKSFPDVRVIQNNRTKGLSGARNTGIAYASGDILAFIDEDAVPEKHWLQKLSDGYRDRTVVGVGGAVISNWQNGKPAWFPEEFNWIVGCSYRGMPQTKAFVRNLIGCNMSFRKSIFRITDGFRPGIGRIGTLPMGCEETELCIRTHQKIPNAQIVYEPEAQVMHLVPPERGTWQYFRKRCFSEGISKALVSGFVGQRSALSSERAYTMKTLPAGIFHGIRESIECRSLYPVLKAYAIIEGLLVTTAGYLSGMLSFNQQSSNQFVEEVIGKCSPMRNVG